MLGLGVLSGVYHRLSLSRYNVSGDLTPPTNVHGLLE
jgi:hypothetical protein